MHQQRMDLDRITEQPFKHVNENAMAAKHKAGPGRAKRAFGNDLTNRHQHQMEQGINNNIMKGKSLLSEPLSKTQMAFEKHKPGQTSHIEMEIKKIDIVAPRSPSPCPSACLDEELLAWDEKDVSSDIHVTDYVNDIMRNLRNDETNNSVVIDEEMDFMEAQNDVNNRMRAVLIDWLIEVHRKFKLLPASYFLAVNLLDRYLSKQQVHRRRLQLAGCTCLWIASKYHEIYAPEMDDFVYISDNAFTDEDMTAMEIQILKTVSFVLTVPTVLNYAERYSKISAFYLKKEKEIKIISNLIMYCLEHSVLSYKLCRKMPSLLGAAAFVYSCLSTKVFSVEKFHDDELESIIGYSLCELVPTMQEIHSKAKDAKKSKQKALYKKYCHPKFSNIGKLNFEKLNTAFLKD